MFKQLVVLVALVGAALAAVSIAQLQTKPARFANSPGCYFEDLDQVIPVDWTIPAPLGKGCRQYRCRETDYTIETCGTVDAEAPCYTTVDTNQYYPNCCPQVRCS